MPRASEAPAVEAAGTRDAPALAQLAAEALPEPWSAEGFLREIGAPHARVWLVRGPAGSPAGYLAAHSVGGELQVLSLAVASAQRRRGLGRALLEHALAAAPEATVAHLEVRSNDADALAFYARLGFGSVGRRRGFYPGGVDAILLARPLRHPHGK